MSKNQEQLNTELTAEDIEMLEKIQSTCAELFNAQMTNYQNENAQGYNTKANQRTALAATGQTWIEATKLLRKIKPGP